MGQKGNLAVFESSSISESKEATATKIGMHACYINPYLHIFWANSNQLNSLMTMDYSPWVKREIWPFLKVAVSPKSEKPRPPKMVYMHVTSIPTCMNFLGRFQSIKFFDDHGL